MGYALRDSDPSLIRSIVVKTEGSRFWLSPNHEVRRTIGGILARYQEMCGVKLYAYNFLSNHAHLLLQAPRGNTDEFFENVNREIARRLNWIHHRSGKFWAKRYGDNEVLSENDVLEAFLYITNNPVRHGLVSHPGLWPGLNSYKQSLNERPKYYSFYHYSAVREEDRISKHTLQLSPLPQFEDLSRGKRIKVMQELIEENALRYVEARQAQGLPFLGVREIQAQDPHDSPQKPAKPLRTPACYSKDPLLIKEHRLKEQQRRNQYAEASARFRLGHLDTSFPLFTYKPPLHRKPRLSPFKPLPDDYFKKVA